MATRQSQIKASRAWEARNKDRVGYISMRRGGLAFIDPKPNTKNAHYIEVANKEEYKKDLEKMKSLIEKKLEELEEE